MTTVWSARSNIWSNGELREDVQYYHRICAVIIVSSAFPIPLGIRFQKKGETEVACTLSLLEDLLDRVGRRFIDLLVADALYLQTPFIGSVEAYPVAGIAKPLTTTAILLTVSSFFATIRSVLKQF